LLRVAKNRIILVDAVICRLHRPIKIKPERADLMGDKKSKKDKAKGKRQHDAKSAKQAQNKKDKQNKSVL
jgi:hypothetical protein